MTEPIQPQVGKIVGPSDLTGGHRIWMADPDLLFEPHVPVFDVQQFQDRIDAERAVWFDEWVGHQIMRPLRMIDVVL